MARKVNAYLAKQEAIFRAECWKERDFARIYDRDLIIVTLADHLGFGKKRIMDFLAAYDAASVELAGITLEEAKDDKRNRSREKERLVYMKETVDRKLREIMGDDWPGWDERYKGL